MFNAAAAARGLLMEEQLWLRGGVRTVWCVSTAGSLFVCSSPKRRTDIINSADIYAQIHARVEQLHFGGVRLTFW